MHASSNVHNQEGFSMVEMMVAITVMLVATGAAFSLMRDSMKVTATTYELTETQEGLRAAQEFINRDLMNAGDGLKSIPNIRVPQTFITNYLTLSPVTDPSTPGFINLAIVTSDNNVPAGTVVRATNPVHTVRSTPVLTDRQTILEIDSGFTPIPLAPIAINSTGNLVTVSSTDITRFNVGEIYFITSSVGGTFGTITGMQNVGTANPQLIFANGDTYGFNITGTGGQINLISAGGVLATSLQRLRIIHYYIDSNGLLKRRVFGVSGAGFNDNVIAEHVVNVQFRYFLNLRDVNGNVVQPLSLLTTSQQQLATRQVEVTVTCETPHALQDGVRQQLSMVTSTSVRNMQFRQALQPVAGG